jgi:hypothetical protein
MLTVGSVALLPWQSRSDLHRVLHQQDLTDRGTVPEEVPRSLDQ